MEELSGNKNLTKIFQMEIAMKTVGSLIFQNNKHHIHDTKFQLDVTKNRDAMRKQKVNKLTDGQLLALQHIWYLSFYKSTACGCQRLAVLCLSE